MSGTARNGRPGQAWSIGWFPLWASVACAGAGALFVLVSDRLIDAVIAEPIASETRLLLSATLFVAGAAASLWLLLRYALWRGAVLGGSAANEPERGESARAQLRDSQLEFLARFGNDIVLFIAPDGRILQANDRALQSYGWSRGELLSRNIRDLRAPGTAVGFEERWRAAEREDGIRFATEHLRRGGAVFPVDVSMRVIEVGGVRYGQALVRDATERVAIEERLRFLTRHDELTGLLNRTGFYAQLEQLIAQHRRHRAALAVLFLDLDRFKQVNDEAGHKAGDAVLQEVARRLRAVLRETDLIARFGGDEFVVALDFLAGGDDARTVAEKLLPVIDGHPFQAGGRSYRVGVSIGVSVKDPEAVSADDLIRSADAAMYEAKAAGKGCVRIHAGKAGMAGRSPGDASPGAAA